MHQCYAPGASVALLMCCYCFLVRRKSVAAAVQKELFEVDGERSLAGASFEVDRLVLWKTPTEEGSRVEDWEKIAEIPLLR